MSSIRFLGAAGTVTGSRYLVRAPGGAVLFDAGLFQGQKELRLRNWEPFPVPPGFSAHADKGEVERWLATAPSPPARVFCVHGEPAPLAATAQRLAGRGWTALVPRHGEEVALA